MKIPQNILKVLEKCRIEGNTLFLPAQLERDVYLQVNKCLTNIGGKWNRVAKGHVFDYDPEEAFENLLLTGETEDMKKVFQFFPTPRAIAEKLCDLAELTEGSRVLEPSVGKGDLADVIWERGNDIVLHCVELNEDMGRYLTDKPYTITLGQDFLEWAKTAPLQPDFVPYTHIIMNPPFTRQQFIDHIKAAFELLAPGGILVSVTGTSWRWRDNQSSQSFRDWLYKNDAVENVEEIDLPEASFKESGTTTPTVIIKLRREGVLEKAPALTTAESEDISAEENQTNGGFTVTENAIKKISDSKGDTKHNQVSFLIAPIAEYLLDRLKDGNEELAEQIMAEHKTFQKCIDFVCEQCKKHLNGAQTGQIADAEVYKMAMDYFAMDDAALERQKALDEAEREEKRKKQIAENERLAAERKAQAEADQAKKAAQKAEQKKAEAAKKKQVTGQLSLFDFGGEDANEGAAQVEADAA